MTRPIVVMGPSGCGKSTLGRQLADALGRPFIEGDDLHPSENRERMAQGIALSDEDRIPFLDAVASALEQNPPPVTSCSALKRSYRDRLRAATSEVFFIHPQVAPDILKRRVAARTAHFMPADLVDDQIATLEPLQPDEAGATIDGMLPADAQLAFALAALAQLR